MIARLFLAGVLLLPAMGPGGSLPDGEARVAEAVRASILGDRERLTELAARTRDAERDAQADETLAENMALLAALAQPTPPTRREALRALSGYGRDGTVRTVLRLIRSEAPRQEFLEARADRRYEGARRTWNALAQPVAGLFSGQFLPLVLLPFDAAEYTISGRLKPTPEARRELITARNPAADATNARPAQTARRAIEKLTPRRARLARLQAVRNAARAAGRGEVAAAIWWYERELALRDETEPRRSGHRRVLVEAGRRIVARNRSLTVTRGEDLIPPGAEYDAYTVLVRAAATGSEHARVDALAESFVRTFPISVAESAAEALRAAGDRAEGNGALASVRLEAMADRPGPAQGWSSRAGALAASPEFAPERLLEDAAAAGRARFWRAVRTGAAYDAERRHLTPEDARLAETAFVRSARSLFVIDMVFRWAFSPLGPAPPHPELFEAAAWVQPTFWETEEGKRWRREVADRLARERRFEEAARLREALGDFEAADRLRSRAAADLHRRARRVAEPAIREAMLRRLLTAYPTYRRAERAGVELAWANAQAGSVLAVDRRDLRMAGAALREAGLPIPETLYDGRAANGEVDREGVLVLAGGGVAWRDRSTGRVVRLPGPAEDALAGARRVGPLLRDRQAVVRARQPLGRRSVPLALEGSALPGFDVFPGLVPLEPETALRRRYE